VDSGSVQPEELGTADGFVSNRELARQSPGTPIATRNPANTNTIVDSGSESRGTVGEGAGVESTAAHVSDLKYAFPGGGLEAAPIEKVPEA
jgi:hypothetical protein